MNQTALGAPGRDLGSDLERLRDTCRIMTTRVAGDPPAAAGFWRVAILRRGDPDGVRLETTSAEWVEALRATVAAAADRGWAR